MGQFRNRFGKAFAALLGISMILALGLEACTTVAPTNSPSTSPTETVAGMQTSALNRTWANTNDGFGGQYPKELLEQINNGQFAIQEAHIKAWVYYWCNASAPVMGCDWNPVYLKDPKTGEVIVGIDDNDNFLFPPLGDEGRIAWDAAPTPDPTQPVADPYGPFGVIKKMTDEIALAAGYSAEMATALDGTVVGYRNGSIVRLTPDRTRIVADIDPATRQYRLVEAAAIDRDLLFNFPESRDDFLNRPAEECVWAPNPLDGIDAFSSWVQTQLIPALGDMEANPANVIIDAIGPYGSDGDNFVNYFPLRANARPLQGRSATFCFNTTGGRYAVEVFKFGNPMGGSYGYRGVILSDATWGSAIGTGQNFGLGSLEAISGGDKIVGVFLVDGKSVHYSDEINALIELGLRAGSNVTGIEMAPGFITTRP